MFAKGKYKFNTETLKFERVRYSTRQQFAKIIPFISYTIFLTLLFLFFSYNYFESPKTKKLSEDKISLLIQLRLLKNDLLKLEETLEDICYNDDNLYRTYFEFDPLPASLRFAGFGGQELENSRNQFKYSSLVNGIAQKINILSKRMVIQTQSFDHVIEMAKTKEKRLAARPAIQPISMNKLIRIGSPFGMRLHPILNIRRMHEGIDLTCPKGTQVYATADGVVLESGYTPGGFGIRIFIDHGYGYKTLYGHLDKVLVAKGDRVKRGDVIGLVGSTGLSLAPHLHYEVIANGRKVNPLNYYTNDLSPEEYDLMINLLSKADPAFDIN